MKEVHLIVRDGVFRYLRSTDPRDLEPFTQRRKDAIEFPSRARALSSMRCLNVTHSSWQCEVLSSKVDVERTKYRQIVSAREQAVRILTDCIARVENLKEDAAHRFEKRLRNEISIALEKSKDQFEQGERLIDGLKRGVLID